ETRAGLPQLLERTTGLEPVTSSLPRKCSTTELCGRETSEPQRITSSHPCCNSVFTLPARSYPVERVSGIEPPSSAWKAEVLPLNYTRLLEAVCHPRARWWRG